LINYVGNERKGERGAIKRSRGKNADSEVELKDAQTWAHLGEPSAVVGLHVLHRLAVLLEHVHSHHSLVEVRVRGLQDFVVQVLFVVNCVEA
jgi:hypothetical protein